MTSETHRSIEHVDGSHYVSAPDRSSWERLPNCQANLYGLALHATTGLVGGLHLVRLATMPYG
jgi:hypothetical protein